jgi:hypothetical protein
MRRSRREDDGVPWLRRLARQAFTHFQFAIFDLRFAICSLQFNGAQDGLA